MIGLQDLLFKLQIHEQDQHIRYCNGFYKIANKVVVHFVWWCGYFIVMWFNDFSEVEKNVMICVVRNLVVSLAVDITCNQAKKRW